MTTERQQAASRRNGAKSRGPVTAAGKAKSSHNATTHGLTAATFVLPCESNERFLNLRDSVFQIYAPANEAELLLARQIAGAMWQLERFASIDTHAVAAQMDLTETQVREQFTDLDTATHLTVAFLDLGNSSRSLQNLDRHQARLRRQLTHYRTELVAIQTIRRQKQKLQNEPGDYQAPAHQQHTSDPASGTSAADHQARSDSVYCLLSPDSSQKLQNEPTGEQAPSNQPFAGSDAAPANGEAPPARNQQQLTPAAVSAPIAGTLGLRTENSNQFCKPGIPTDQ